MTPSRLSRREILGLAAASPLWMALGQREETVGPIGRQQIVDSHAGVRVDGRPDALVEVVREWDGAVCRSHVVNHGAAPVKLKEVVLVDAELALAPATSLYGEGFQMLSQTGGTVAAPVDFSQYTDAKHYRMPAAEGARAYYGLLTLTPPGDDTRVLAFTSCARFSGRFELTTVQGGSPLGQRCKLRAVVDTEGLELAPGESWNLEELLLFDSGSDRSRLLSDVARRLASHPPGRATPRRPAGARVLLRSARHGSAGAGQPRCHRKKHPSLKYIQIDDGYQSAMGLARHWRGVRWRYPHRARADSPPRVRTGDLGGAVRRRRRLEGVPAASRLVHQGRRRRAAAIRSRYVRRLASRAVVRAGRHSPGGAAASRAGLQHDARSMGLHVLQAGRELLGRDAWRTLSRPARDTS